MGRDYPPSSPYSPPLPSLCVREGRVDNGGKWRAKVFRWYDTKFHRILLHGWRGWHWAGIERWKVRTPGTVAPAEKSEPPSFLAGAECTFVRGPDTVSRVYTWAKLNEISPDVYSERDTGRRISAASTCVHGYATRYRWDSLSNLSAR